jgi:hypothetical protein
MYPGGGVSLLHRVIVSFTEAFGLYEPVVWPQFDAVSVNQDVITTAIVTKVREWELLDTFMAISI